jgi:hypothetical protein
MKKPKTVEGWLKTLPEPLRSEAFNVAYLCDLNTKCGCLSFAILLHIKWEYEEGSFEFWDSFFHAIIWAESKEG